MQLMNIKTQTFLQFIEETTKQAQSCVMVVRTIGPDACTDADKKCNFFMWATVSGSTRCYFGRFARDARTPINDTGLESGADIQNGIWYNGVVKLKRGLL